MAPLRIQMPDKAPKIIRKEMIPDARALAIVPIRAFKDKTLTAGQFRALGIMCTYTNKAGFLWAGLQRMGQDLGISGQAMQVYAKALEAKGYVRTVYKGFKGERANTRQIIYNPGITPMQASTKTATDAPFIAEKQAKQTKRKAKSQANKSQNQAQSIDNGQDVAQSTMQSVHNVMRLKNKVSASIWQLAIQRANSETDYAAIKAAIDKLLR